MKSHVDLVPFGGLGNRLRVLNSGLFLTKEADVNIHLDWIVKAELNAEFGDLFSGTSIAFDYVPKWKQKIFKLFLKHYYIQKNKPLYKFLLSFYYDSVIFDHDILALSKSELLETIVKSPKVLIATCLQFWDFRDYNNLVLNPSIALELSKKKEELGCFENVVGVHVRRTDHLEILSSTTLEAYIYKMNVEIGKDENVKFFLCTDDIEVKNELRTQFGGKILSNDVELSRQTEIGMIGAMLDIYLLAETVKIIANSKSSFAVLASKLGRKKEIIEV